jgi:hypothetical protein
MISSIGVQLIFNKIQIIWGLDSSYQVLHGFLVDIWGTYNLFNTFYKAF